MSVNGKNIMKSVFTALSDVLAEKNPFEKLKKCLQITDTVLDEEISDLNQRYKKFKAIRDEILDIVKFDTILNEKISIYHKKLNHKTIKELKPLENLVTEIKKFQKENIETVISDQSLIEELLDKLNSLLTEYVSLYSSEHDSLRQEYETYKYSIQEELFQFFKSLSELDLPHVQKARSVELEIQKIRNKSCNITNIEDVLLDLKNEDYFCKECKYSIGTVNIQKNTLLESKKNINRKIINGIKEYFQFLNNNDFKSFLNNKFIADGKYKELEQWNKNFLKIFEDQETIWGELWTNFQISDAKLNKLQIETMNGTLLSLKKSLNDVINKYIGGGGGTPSDFLRLSEFITQFTNLIKTGGKAQLKITEINDKFSSYCKKLGKQTLIKVD